MNTLAALAEPLGKDGDPYRFIERLQSIPLTNSPQLGRIAFGTVLEARQPAGKNGPAPGGINPPQIDAAFRDTAAGEVQLIYQHAGEALEHLRAIDSLLRSAVGMVHAPNLAELEKALSTIRTIVGPYVNMAVPPPTPAGTPLLPTLSGAAPSDSVVSREDVLRVLGQVRSFYSKHEPASPIPLLIRRIERMVPMTFLEVLADMAPDAVKEVNKIVGPQSQ
jgi:type VI secretion system protein ImpA